MGFRVVELVSDVVVLVSELVLVGSVCEDVVEVSEGVVEISDEVVEDVEVVDVDSLVGVGVSEEVEEVEEEVEVVVSSEEVVVSGEELVVVSVVRPPSRSVASALCAATAVRSNAWARNESFARRMVMNETRLGWMRRRQERSWGDEKNDKRTRKREGSQRSEEQDNEAGANSIGPPSRG